MKFTPVIALTLCVVFSTQVLSQDDLPECPQFDWLTISSTIDELLYTQLEKGGPADGKCSLNDKWIIHGDPYDLPSVCTCIEIPTKPGKETKRCFNRISLKNIPLKRNQARRRRTMCRLETCSSGRHCHAKLEEKL